METTSPSIDTIIKDQIEKWKKQTHSNVPVITISSQPGSGGRLLARRLAERFNIHLFDREMVKQIAESAHISGTVIESIEKARLSGIHDFISSLVNDRYLWPGVYLDHLMDVVASIASHGNAIIVGRGANFLIPKKKRISIRVIAPLDVRVGNVAREFGVAHAEAKRRVINRENRRAAFIHQAFHADVNDPQNYDLVINTDCLNHAAALGAVIGMVVGEEDAVKKPVHAEMAA